MSKDMKNRQSSRYQLNKGKNVIGRRRNARTAGMREALTRLRCRIASAGIFSLCRLGSAMSGNERSSD